MRLKTQKMVNESKYQRSRGIETRRNVEKKTSDN